MELKEIVSVSGIGGLHKIIGRTKTGLILESLNETKKRFPTKLQDKVSILSDISMYTQEGDMPLAEVFVKLHEKGNVPTGKDDAKKQRQFLVDVIKLDSERVYDSDIKKLFNWYDGVKNLVDFATLNTPAEETAEATEKVEEAVVEAEVKPKKAAAKKTAAKTATKTATPKATKVTSKSASNANTYRPKSV